MRKCISRHPNNSHHSSLGKARPHAGMERQLAAAGTLVAAALLAGCSVADASESFPADQAEFVDAVNTAKDAADGANEMKVVQLRETRNDAICGMLPKSLAVEDWYGVVSDLDTTMGGDSGTLEVELDDRIALGTWNNGFSDALDGASSLISRDSPVYEQVADLSEGDLVQFSGKFMRDKKDCVGEKSMTDVGGVRSPTFVFAFTDVVPAKAAGE
ncbi:hypothetical protein KDN32_21490 [Nocardioides sp. J2M5]|uniref:hypothetical protein n=1 Tax=Nocardioides palaemonis TaxID=2829810 RepID=UPI001BA67952|nr:hypothetical protein [Nocardioides palaemonis]MBS2940318.1 hypothetical protein [Nocardioides palaemonis]